MHTCICTLSEARAVLATVGRPAERIALETPPNAAETHGVLWFAEMNRALQAEFPDVSFTLTLDCGDRADLAHAALVEGIKRIRFSGHADAGRALKDVAAQLGAEVCP